MPTFGIDADAFYQSLRQHGGAPHGEDAHGIADISFPTILQAASFAAEWHDVTTVKLREPVTDFTTSCVVQIDLLPYPFPRS